MFFSLAVIYFNIWLNAFNHIILHVRAVTLHSGTYLYSLYISTSPHPWGRGSREKYCSSCIVYSIYLVFFFFFFFSICGEFFGIIFICSLTFSIFVLYVGVEFWCRILAFSQLTYDVPL